MKPNLAQRDLTNNVRNNDREIGRLTNERDKKLQMIKACALKGDHNTGKILAKEVQRLNTQIAAMGKVSGTLTGVKGKITQVNALDQMGNSLECGAKAMALANQNIDTNKIRTQAQNYQKNEMKMNLHEDIMQEVLGEIGDNDYDLSEEADKVYREACGYKETYVQPQYHQPKIVNTNIVQPVHYKETYVQPQSYQPMIAETNIIQPIQKRQPEIIPIAVNENYSIKPQPKPQQQHKEMEYFNKGNSDSEKFDSYYNQSYPKSQQEVLRQAEKRAEAKGRSYDDLFPEPYTQKGQPVSHGALAGIALKTDGSYSIKPVPAPKQQISKIPESLNENFSFNLQSQVVDYSNTGDAELDAMLAELMH